MRGAVPVLSRRTGANPLRRCRVRVDETAVPGAIAFQNATIASVQTEPVRPGQGFIM